jgi:hypothetical protein
VAEKKLSDYSEEFFLAWELALEKRLELTFESKGQALNFRQRLYGFRQRLRREDPLSGIRFDGIELSIEPKGTEWVLGTTTSRWREQIRALAAQRTLPFKETEK